MLSDIHNPPSPEQIQTSIAHKQHLNLLLDKILHRERVRIGYGANSKEIGTMTDEKSGLKPIVNKN